MKEMVKKMASDSLAPPTPSSLPHLTPEQSQYLMRSALRCLLEEEEK